MNLVSPASLIIPTFFQTDLSYKLQTKKQTEHTSIIQTLFFSFCEMALAINVSSSSSSAISTSSFPSSDLKGKFLRDSLMDHSEFGVQNSKLIRIVFYSSVSAPRIGSLRLSDRVNVSSASLSLSGKRSSSVKPLNVQSFTKESSVPSQTASSMVASGKVLFNL